MSSTTLNLPYKRFVAQVSTGAPRPKSTYLSLMAENLEALRACPWREAAEVPVALVNHDFTAASHFSDAYDAFKMTGAWDANEEKEVAFAGMAAYRFAIPASAASVAISSVTLPISRDRFLLGGVHVAAVLDNSATPSDDWAVVTGQGASAYLANSAANIVASRPADGALTITSTDLASLATTGRAYLWIYVTLEDYVDWWQQYSATEARQYAIEGSAMLVGGSAEVTFGGDVTPDAEPAVLLAGGSSPTWLQPLPTVNVGDEAPEVSASAEQVDTFFTSAVRASAPKSATWQISGNSGLFSFDAAISLFGTDPDSVSGSISVTGPDFSKAEQNSQGAIPTESLTEQGTMTVVTSGAKKYLHYISTAAGYYALSGGTSFYYPARLHVYIQLPGFVAANESQGMYTSTSADAKWFTRINIAQTPDPSVTQNAASSGILYGTFGSASTVAQVCDVASVYWMLKMAGGVPTGMDMCGSPNEASRQGLASVVTGSASPWSVSVGGHSFAVALAGRAVTLSESASGNSWDFTLSEELAGENYFDPAVRLYLPGEDANDAAADYGMASVVGDFSHAVATFEAGTQPPHAEVLGRLARMSRAAAGAMLYLHPESGALVDELDVLRPVPRFWRASSDPTGQTACQPGLSVWYRRSSTPSDVALGIVQRAALGQEGVVSDPAFLQLALIALRAPSAFGTRLVLQNFKPDTTTPTTNVATSVTNHFKLRFVAWRSPAEQWDGSNAFAMAAMASMPSIYRADGPSSVAWSVDCTGSLLRFGTRAMTAERIGVSKTIIGDIAASAEIEIPIVSPVGEGDVVLVAPEVLGFADGAGGASKWFGRPSDPSRCTAGWARYTHNLGWFPRVTGE